MGQTSPQEHLLLLRHHMPAFLAEPGSHGRNFCGPPHLGPSLLECWRSYFLRSAFSSCCLPVWFGPSADTGESTLCLSAGGRAP